MAHLGATYALNPIVARIMTEIEMKVEQCRGVESEIASLQLDLNRLVAQMDVDLKRWRGAPSDAVARHDFEVMRDLVHDMEDCIERFLYKIKRKKTSGLDGLIPDGIHMTKKYLGTRAKCSKRIREIKKCSEEAINRRRAGQQAPVGPALPPPVPRRRVPVDGNPVGIARAMGELRTLLLDEVAGEPKKLRVISIVGFGGSGKTTLARTVYKSLTDGATVFPLHAWVDRADYSDAGSLLRCITQQFWRDANVHMNERQLEDHIKQRLRKNRYLIVLDDMEDTDEHCWSWIQSAFVDNGTSSRIVVTTSGMVMAAICSKAAEPGSGFLYKTRPLGDRGSGELAFRNHRPLEGRSLPEQILLTKCDGLPLALVSVAKDLVSRTGALTRRERCENLGKELGSFLQEEANGLNQMTFADLRSVLMGHYTSLSGSTVRPCLLYLGICTAGGRLIKKNRVTRRWVAEGYAESNDPKERQKVANGHFQELIDRNIIEPVGIRSSRTYKVIGVVQEFVLHRSISDKFIMHFSSSQQLPASTQEQIIRHIFVKNYSDDTTTGTTLKVKLSRVRSLTVSGSAGGYFSQFEEYKLMRVLDLEECTDVNDSHLKGICKMRNLRYLSLCSNISSLPKDITGLELLESIHLSKERVSQLPVEVIGMPRLIHLIGKFKLSYNKKDEKYAKEFSVKSKVQTLAGFVADGEEVFLLLISNMKNLRKVKIWCDRSEMESLNTRLSQVILNYATQTQGQNRSLSIGFVDWTLDDFATLQNLSPNGFFGVTANTIYLSELKLHDKLPAVPQFVTVLRELKKVCLSLTIVTNEVLSTMSRLPCLEHLKLIADRITADHWFTMGEFPSLTSLCFDVRGIDEVIPEIHFGDGALPELVTLQLLCKDLAGLYGINNLTNLREIELHCEVSREARRNLQAEAHIHPNRPNVLPTVSLDVHDDPDVEPRHPVQHSISQNLYTTVTSWLHRTFVHNF